MARPRKAAEVIGELGFMLAIFGGLGTIVLQCTFWVQNGYWTAFAVGELLLRMGIVKPRIEWDDAQTIINWIYLKCPLSIVLLLFGILIHFSFAGRAYRSAGKHHLHARRRGRSELPADELALSAEEREAVYRQRALEYSQQRKACGLPTGRVAKEEDLSRLGQTLENPQAPTREDR